jgi:outer membrane protein TolC
VTSTAWISPLCAIGFAALLVTAHGCASSNSNDPAQHKSVDAAAAVASDAVAAGEPIVFTSTAGEVDVADASPETLTLDEAARRALRADPGLQAALARVRLAQADVDQAKLFPNPVLSVSVRFPANGKSIIDASLAENLVAFLTRPGRVSAADNRLRASSAEAVAAALDVVAEVQQRYAAAQALDELMPVLEQRRQLLERLRSLADARRRAGEGTRFDVTTFDAQKVELAVEIAEQKLARRRERLALARLIGQPSGASEWKLSRWQPLPRFAGTETDWVRAALENRPELQSTHFELLALGAERRIAGLSILEGTEAGVDSERDPDWSVGPALSVPLPMFDWGQASSAAALARFVDARHRLTQARRKAVEEVRRAYETFTASQDTLDMVRAELIPLQEQRREQSEGAYKLGTTDVTGLFIAEQELQAARARLIDLQHRTSDALIELQRSVGGPGVAAHLVQASTRPVTSQPSSQPTTGMSR